MNQHSVVNRRQLEIYSRHIRRLYTCRKRIFTSHVPSNYFLLHRYTPASEVKSALVRHVFDYMFLSELYIVQLWFLMHQPARLVKGLSHYARITCVSVRSVNAPLGMHTLQGGAIRSEHARNSLRQK